MNNGLKLFIMITFIMLLSLCSCSNKESNPTYIVEMEGIEFEVNPEEKTVYDGTYTYEYTLSGNKLYYVIHIYYPNGSIYSYNHDNKVGNTTMTGEFKEIYVSPTLLCDVITEEPPKSLNMEIVFIKIITFAILVIIGLFEIIFPHIAWYIEYGWRFKNKKPSEVGIAINRLIGIFMIVMGLVVIFL